MAGAQVLAPENQQGLADEDAGMKASDATFTMTWEDAATALARARAAFQALIMDAEAEGRSRLAAGRPDFVQMLAPLHDLKAGLAVVEELAKMLNDVRDAPESVKYSVINKIALGLAEMKMVRGEVNH